MAFMCDKQIGSLTLIIYSFMQPLFFFPPIFGNGIATIATKNFFFPYFGNGIATIGFFF